MTKQSAPASRGWQGDALELVRFKVFKLEAVVLRQWTIHPGMFGGEQIDDGEVFLDRLAEQQRRLTLHLFLQTFLVVEEKGAVVGRHLAELVKAQPLLGEVRCELFDPFVPDEPLDLRPSNVRIGQVGSAQGLVQ